jgi:hypothetical protein
MLLRSLQKSGIREHSKEPYKKKKPYICRASKAEKLASKEWTIKMLLKCSRNLTRKTVLLLGKM